MIKKLNLYLNNQKQETLICGIALFILIVVELGYDLGIMTYYLLN